MADGGEGTADALRRALGGVWRHTTVSDPLGRPITAQWLVLPDGTAVVDAAAAIGLPLLTPDELDPLRASSRGLGELLVAALEESPTSLVVGLGGTATVDGGEGLRSVLTTLETPCVALADVETLLGDAARVFGPQKGASPDQVRVLEARLRELDELRAYAEVPGSGAAGGLGAAFLVLGAELRPGARTVLDLLGFEAHLERCDVVVTGEGRVDATTVAGKAPGEVARRAAAAGTRCVVFGGRIETEVPGAEMYELSGDAARADEDLVVLGRMLANRSVKSG